MPSQPFLAFSSFLVLACLAGPGLAQEPSKETDSPPSENATPAGHSYHGEVFNEGPRQAAYLMAGMGNCHLKITTKNPMAQRFFDQGIGQLHGFWYFESERSFRQTAAFDPDCAMAYWGMAMSNLQNEPRAKAFVIQAMDRRSPCQDYEKKLIEALHRRLKDAPDLKKDKKPGEESKKEAGKAPPKKERLERYTRDLEEILYDHPDLVEVRAFLAAQIWENDRGEIRIQSHLAVNALLEEVFRANPRHPAHHYRIHLWDYKKANLAVHASGACGPAAPGIAHMWHMPGHIYSRLHRYQDAAWQQEASARVDHAHMMRDAVLPDQIHNFAHNNEWLIRNLVHVGRVREAIDLACNMISLPRHPKYNSFTKRGSASYGRERLMDVLTTYRLWSDLLRLSDSVFLEPTDDEGRQDERIAWRIIAARYCKKDSLCESENAELASRLGDVEKELRKLESQHADAALAKPKVDAQGNVVPRRPPSLDNPDLENPTPWKLESDRGDDSKSEEANEENSSDEATEFDGMSDGDKDRLATIKKLRGRRGKLRNFQIQIDAHRLAHQGQFAEALRVSRKIGRAIDPVTKAEWTFAVQPKEALKQIAAHIKKTPGEVVPLAVGAYLAWEHEDRKLALEWIEELMPIAAVSDKGTMLLQRLQGALDGLEKQSAWTAPFKEADDLGDRPALDSLGPFRWSPYAAPPWSLVDAQGKPTAMKMLRGKPTILVFYLGFGCLHCVEQLKTFSPKLDAFREAGIDILAISSESHASLQKSIEAYGDAVRIPLLANPEHDVFRAYRCYDDFEGQPLHATFLIDPRGRVQWQDIGHEPFQDVDFLLKESARLLQLTTPGSTELLSDFVGHAR